MTNFFYEYNVNFIMQDIDSYISIFQHSNIIIFIKYLLSVHS